MGKILSPDQRVVYLVADEESDGFPEHSLIALLHPPPNLRPEDSELALDEVLHAFLALIEFKDVDPLELYRRLDVDRGANIAERHHTAFLTWNAEAP